MELEVIERGLIDEVPEPRVRRRSVAMVGAVSVGLILLAKYLPSYPSHPPPSYRHHPQPPHTTNPVHHSHHPARHPPHDHVSPPPKVPNHPRPHTSSPPLSTVHRHRPTRHPPHGLVSSPPATWPKVTTPEAAPAPAHSSYKSSPPPEEPHEYAPPPLPNPTAGG